MKSGNTRRLLGLRAMLNPVEASFYRDSGNAIVICRLISVARLPVFLCVFSEVTPWTGELIYVILGFPGSVFYFLRPLRRTG